ncbi:MULTISPECIES: flagellar export protein FliJ [Hydrogenophaga]|uniref:Flagellar FliJ protein n=1 Tax=Hydrogenophaga electricum TaxID=1230953 RepID=A0ABQ6C539_9BURK|nr:MULTISPECIES: flagellar export protein FliJ [Hydrogenophaga]GLS15437.1 flagellar export protein FliJ [Hydrogenophaga electricum]
MTPIHTLNKVVELAEKRRDEAVGKLAQQQREMQAAQDQMNQLQSYALEAQARWTTRCQQGVDAQFLFHHRQFMQKIDHAIAFQEGVLSSRQELIDSCQQQVIAAERDVAGLRKYAERQQHALQQRAQRQEQKATDEMALSIHLRQSLASFHGVRP